jgi:hypothetical protein
VSAPLLEARQALWSISFPCVSRAFVENDQNVQRGGFSPSFFCVCGGDHCKAGVHTVAAAQWPVVKAKKSNIEARQREERAKM